MAVKPGWMVGDGRAVTPSTSPQGGGFSPTGQPNGWCRQLPNPHRANDPYRTSGYDDYPGPQLDPSPPVESLEPFEVPTERFDNPRRRPKKAKARPAKAKPEEHVGGYARVVCKCGVDVAATPIQGPDVIVMTVDTCPACLSK